MSKSLLQDNFDLILLAILEDAPKYGLEIIAEARSRTDGYFNFKEGSLYPALHRLEKATLVEVEFAPLTTGEPRRRYYRLTDAGTNQLAERREAWKRSNDAVGALWGPKRSDQTRRPSSTYNQLREGCGDASGGRSREELAVHIGERALAHSPGWVKRLRSNRYSPNLVARGR